MRLICPVCDAQYEVDAALLPPEGRAVECANCGHGWHQPGNAPQPLLLGDPEIAPEIEPRPAPATASAAAPSTPRPRPSAAVLDILREEAARELAQREAARAAAARRAAAEPQPELIVAELVEDHDIPTSTATPFPDRDAWAASLRWPGPEAPTPAPRRTPPPPALMPVQPVAAPGYSAGFGLALGFAVLLGGAYAAAPLLSDAGRVGAGLSEYRLEADRARLWLYDRAAPLADRAVTAVRQLAR